MTISLTQKSFIASQQKAILQSLSVGHLIKVGNPDYALELTSGQPPIITLQR